MKRIITILVASAAFVTLHVWGTMVRRGMPSLPVVHADSPTSCSTETGVSPSVEPYFFRVARFRLQA